jgi:hypothetical protein
MLKQREQTTKPKLKQHKEFPLHICKLPLSQSTLPPETMQQCNMGMQQRAKFYSACPGRLDRLHQAVRLPTYHLTAWWAVRPPHETSPAPNFSKNYPNHLEHLPNALRCPKHAQTSPPCWQCMNHGKMQKVSTYSFSNLQNSSQDATHVQMSKLGTLQVRNDLNYMITKFHNHWTRLKRIWEILRKFTLSWVKY